MKTWYRFGEILQTPEITATMVADLFTEGRQRLTKFRQVPLPTILRIIDAAAAQLADPAQPLRQEALAVMPDIIGFSPEMTAAGLDTLADTLQQDHLLTRLNSDLDNAGYLDDFQYQSAFDSYIRAEPRGIIAHVSAGNVFIGAVDTLVQGIITKNINILKMSSADPVFPILFARALQAVDPEGVVANTFCLVPFSGGDQEIEQVLKAQCNAIVVYGGEDAVMAYRDGLALHGKLIEYGPKYSCAIVDGDWLQQHGDFAETVKQLARDFTMWDQSACSSPHTVFVSGEGQARALAAALAEQLAAWAQIYPHGRIPIDEQVEITKYRESARAHQALGAARLLIPANDRQDWTVIDEDCPDFKVSCHHRTAFVKPVAQPDDAVEILRPYGEYIQSIAIVADDNTIFRLGRALTALGADRITQAGQMTRRKHGTPHDGTRGAAEFVRWVSVAKPDPFADPFDFRPDAERDALTLERLNALLAYGRRHSPFYRERLPERPLRTLAELATIPLVAQTEFRAHLPPQGQGLLTQVPSGAFSFGSGGTSGQPKFIYRTVEETRRNARALAKGMRLSALAPGDTVANLFFAGNMWASFISTTQALEQAECHILPIAGNVCDLETIFNYLRAFEVDAAISIPSLLLSLAQYAEQHGIRDVQIPKMLYGGEPLFPDAMRYIASILGTRQFASAGYATNDSGAIGYQCAACQGGVHHIHEDLHIVEIIDPESGAPVPVGEVGNIVVTNIDRRLMPTIRYDIGDRGRLLPEPCACGRRTRRLELLGRSDEVLIIGGVNLSLNSISQAIAATPGLSFHFRMSARTDNLKDQLILEIETVETVSADQVETLRETVYRHLLWQNLALQKFLDTASIAPPVVRILAPGALPRNPRTGKIKQVIDERSHAL